MSFQFAASSKRPRQPKYRAILALDLDCFYASVAIRERPHLRDKPVVIVQKHLCVTSNYVARSRAKGAVQKMTPVSVAKRACSDLILIDGSDLTPFRAASLEVLIVIRKWLTQQVLSFSTNTFDCPCQRLGFDEVFIDITNLVEARIQKGQQPWRFDGHVFGDTDDDTQRRFLMVASQIAHQLRQYVIKETQLTLCAGISNSKLLAKLAVNMHKPNDQTIFLPKHASNYVATISPRSIPGFGYGTSTKIDAWLKKTNHNLKEIKCIADVLTLFGNDPSGARTLTKIVGNEATATKILNLCHAIDPSEVIDSGNAPKSITSEDSFKSCTTIEDVHNRVKIQVNKLIIRLYLDGQTYCRRPKTFSVAYRFRTQKWARTARSMPMPIEITSLSHSSCTEDMKERVQHVLEKLVLHVLKQHAGVSKSQQFNLTLIAISASNFVDNDCSNKEDYNPTQSTNFFRKDISISTKAKPGDSKTIEEQSNNEKSPPKKKRKLESESNTQNKTSATCPICNKHLSLNNILLNKHIDQCVGIEEKTTKQKKNWTTSQTRRVDSFFQRSRG